MRYLIWTVLQNGDERCTKIYVHRCTSEEKVEMKVYMLIAFLLTFVFCYYFGKRFIPWLEKKNIRQPLKDEVAQVYKQDDVSDSK